MLCLELAAILWQRMGWMKPSSPNEFTPADFAGDGLQVEDGVELGPVVMLKGVAETDTPETINED